MAKTARKKPKSDMGVYSNLAYRRKVKADQKARKKAEDLAKLPKNPFLRTLAGLHPKRVFHFWFSKEGLFRVLKIMAAGVLLVVIAIGGLFLYFKKDLDAIRPEELAARVTDTVNTYLDRNCVNEGGDIDRGRENCAVLWEDKGDGDYRLVVDGSEISTYMRQATVAIEDKNFYNHIGVDFTALVRAFLATTSGNSVQGGSTLTQQLIKQVYFADEANKRDASGIPRKIKEVILALEVEKMYDKEQIITLYMNESPYGGRRNGVESGARTYFGKSAKDLTLAESALLASIPNSPAVLNPYNIAGHKSLISRQKKTLDAMVDMGYITQEQAEEAKAVPILDTILPEESQYHDIKAPHFVLEVKKQIEEKFGVKTIRSGGFTFVTTLDYRAQRYAEEAVAKGSEYIGLPGADNMALSSIDVETGQIIAMVGSVDWNKTEYGQMNAATSLLEPASSIKPVLDYAALFQPREGQNFGPGSILRDENIDRIYCAGYVGKCGLSNWNNSFAGDVTIRNALGSSLNIPAVKALYINGVSKSLEVAHALGDLSYCVNESNAGLSMAIGGGCRVRQVEHANAYASFARGGVYRPLAYWLEIKNSSGDTVDMWEDTAGERAVNEEVAYMLSNILSDKDARRLPSGLRVDNGNDLGFVVPGVWTATKTGTTDSGKDLWMMSYSSVISTSVWTGNHDGKTLRNTNNTGNRWVINNYMENVHKNVYGPDGKWKAGDQPARPAGIQELVVNGRKDIWPSWYSAKTSGIEKIKMVFDSVTKKLATECTPPETRVEIEVLKIIDPMTKKEIWLAEGYDVEGEDDLHICGDARPTAGAISFVPVLLPDGTVGYTATLNVTAAGRELESYEVIVDGVSVAAGNVVGSIIHCDLGSDFKTVKIIVRDVAGYEVSRSANHP
jgi:penicillin-binding protein 1A